MADSQDQLQSSPEVLGVRFISKDEELRRFAQDPRNQRLLEQLSGNPVPAKVEVTVRRLGDVPEVDALARRWRGVDRSDPTDYQGDFIQNLLRLSTWLTVGGLGLLLILRAHRLVTATGLLPVALALGAAGASADSCAPGDSVCQQLQQAKQRQASTSDHLAQIEAGLADAQRKADQVQSLLAQLAAEIATQQAAIALTQSRISDTERQIRLTEADIRLNGAYQNPLSFLP